MNAKSLLLVITLLGTAVLLLLGNFALGLAQFDSPVAQAAGELQAPEDLARTITVVGEGNVSAPPDIAVVYIGVQVIDPDVKVATDKAAQDMNSLLAALKGEGIAEKDIQTSYYSVYVDRPYGPQGPAEQAQYQVSNNVQVTIRDLDKVTNILGAAIEAGANNINSVEFRLSDTSALQAEARAKAVEKAKAKAEELAELNGVAVGEVVNISEVIDQGAYFISEQSYGARDMGGAGGAGPISPGDVSVTAQLQITYAMLR
ncbi:MAG: SIMPL domain-containing protein [Anaerolineae bacterium]|nr:SIMPL domain-containing protein [Anaerolineae bacterium]